MKQGGAFGVLEFLGGGLGFSCLYDCLQSPTLMGQIG